MGDDNKKETTICPHCNHENESGTTTCAKCGRQLLLTVPVDTGQLLEAQLSRGIPDADRVSLMADTLAFLIPGFTEPLHVDQSDEMVLGRQMPDEPVPEIDLTIYNAYAMGVSRRHALIRCWDEGYTIEDLGSANGTWVNENRLVPHKPRMLHSGDQIRIGHLVLFVYFKALMSIFLVDTGSPLVRRRKLTPHFLANYVSPYLRALADVQILVDDMLGRAPSEVALHTISVSANGVINVRLEKVADTVRLMREIIQPWKQAYIDETEVIQKPEDLELSKKDTQEALDTMKRSTQEIVRAAALDLLIEQVIHSVAPRLSEQDRTAYAQKLKYVLPVLVTSTLELSDTPSLPKEE